MRNASTFEIRESLLGGLIGKREVARILACSVRTVERLVAVGALEKVMVLGAVRFRVHDVQKIVKEGTV
jgi:excisionase family DNA binding protein